ncbi:YdbH family protein [Superficieibacter electus]|uniref:YdbH family protein n=1 Tax=Superficieibacter electus TaxID=2022662 RepID=A0A2P5GUW7_9ENTR|nr:YdbH family protein [Superficieibacter electus]POP44327.1 YdbH family protein [Superficieibacter electus]POP50345.1 YdbH family protein [Superficieibacter electus]
MKGRYKAALALLLLIILLPLALLMTLGWWVPKLAGIWLPEGTRIALERAPELSLRALRIPDMRYIVADCELAHVKQGELTHPSRWRLTIAELTINSACLSKLPQTEPSVVAPRTLAQWQSMLPYSWVNIDHLILSPWQQWQGSLALDLSAQKQAIRYQGKALSLAAQLRGQALVVDEFALRVQADQPPITLSGQFVMPLVPDGLPVEGHTRATLQVPAIPSPVDIDLEWRDGQGQLLALARESGDALVDLPWQLTAQQLTISDGRWNWPWQAFPLSGRLGVNVKNWQQGLDKAVISGRMNVITTGNAGKGNAVLNFGPGKLSPESSDMPMQLTGEAKHDDLIFYAVLPAHLSGRLDDPQLALMPGALLRSRGRVIDSLNLDEIRWPLAGVKVSQRGIDGRLQAILRAHESQMGDFILHLDGKAQDFLPDNGLWQWRYWGDGSFTPMQARWDVAGTGEWRDERIILKTLSTGFNQLRYGAMQMNTPRLVLDKPVIWQRDRLHPRFTGALTLNAGQTTFSGGSVLPPSLLNFSVEGSDPTLFQFKGDLHAQAIGPVRVNGRWDGERLRGQAWWPEQSLTVFQPLLPPDWKIDLRDGTLYAQVAFSAAAGQGFTAGGHGVVNAGSAWLPDNKINGVDFVLPFRYGEGSWQLGTHGPVSLRIAEIENQFTAKNVTAHLQGRWPWSEDDPLLFSDVSVDILGGKITLLQLRMPQHDAALLRVQNISAGELISAINPKQFTMSGPVSGALPLWLNNEKWLIKDGWLTNPGPLTLRIDKDTADAIVNDNMAAGAAINWLRYIEISRSWTTINVDNLGLLTLQATISGLSRVEGKSNAINLNYHHQENVFTLWRSLRFGDNLQSWLEKNATLPDKQGK